MKVADSILDWLGSGEKLDECYIKKINILHALDSITLAELVLVLFLFFFLLTNETYSKPIHISWERGGKGMSRL